MLWLGFVPHLDPPGHFIEGTSLKTNPATKNTQTSPKGTGLRLVGIARMIQSFFGRDVGFVSLKKI